MQYEQKPFYCCGERGITKTMSCMVKVGHRSMAPWNTYMTSLGWSNSSSHAYPSEKGKEKIWEGERRFEFQEDNARPSGVTNGWVPHGNRWEKLNTDASFCQSTRLAGIGVVAWDSQGKVLLSAWCFLYNVASA
jgi:hypothetical protein